MSHTVQFWMSRVLRSFSILFIHLIFSLHLFVYHPSASSWFGPCIPASYYSFLLLGLYSSSVPYAAPSVTKLHTFHYFFPSCITIWLSLLGVFSGYSRCSKHDHTMSADVFSTLFLHNEILVRKYEVVVWVSVIYSVGCQLYEVHLWHASINGWSVRLRCSPYVCPYNFMYLYIRKENCCPDHYISRWYRHNQSYSSHLSFHTSCVYQWNILLVHWGLLLLLF